MKSPRHSRGLFRIKIPKNMDVGRPYLYVEKWGWLYSGFSFAFFEAKVGKFFILF